MGRWPITNSVVLSASVCNLTTKRSELNLTLFFGQRLIEVDITLALGHSSINIISPSLRVPTRFCLSADIAMVMDRPWEVNDSASSWSSPNEKSAKSMRISDVCVLVSQTLMTFSENTTDSGKNNRRHAIGGFIADGIETFASIVHSAVTYQGRDINVLHLPVTRRINKAFKD